MIAYYHVGFPNRRNFAITHILGFEYATSGFGVQVYVVAVKKQKEKPRLSTYQGSLCISRDELEKIPNLYARQCLPLSINKKFSY